MGRNEIAVLNEIQKRDDFVQLRGNIRQAVGESKAIIIFGEEQVDKAGYYIKNFRQLGKKLESLRKEIVAPLNEDVKTINSFFKSLIAEYEAEENRLVSEVDDWLREKREREEEQKKKEQQELEDSLLNEAEIFEDESVLDNIPEIEIKTTGLGQVSANITTMKLKKWRVVDFDKIDRKYLIVDEELINRLRKEADFDDKSPIEGIEYYVAETIRTK